jgi:hypothetical protein
MFLKCFAVGALEHTYDELQPMQNSLRFSYKKILSYRRKFFHLRTTKREIITYTALIVYNDVPSSLVKKMVV